VATPLALVHLLSLGADQRSLRGGRVASDGVPKSVLGRLLCNSRLRFFLLYTSTVVCRVIAPAATELRLSSRDRISTGDAKAPTREASGCVPVVTLRVFEALAAFTFQWSL
jgi:hypothetical protein